MGGSEIYGEFPELRGCVSILYIIKQVLQTGQTFNLAFTKNKVSSAKLQIRNLNNFNLDLGFLEMVTESARL